jgi:hypothetical protein
LGAGLIARVRRPGNPTGWLMIVTGFVFMWGALEFASDGTDATLGAAGAGALLPLFLWIVVGFPTAALRTAAERAMVAAAFRVVGCDGRVVRAAAGRSRSVRDLRDRGLSGAAGPLGRRGARRRGDRFRGIAGGPPRLDHGAPAEPARA